MSNASLADCRANVDRHAPARKVRVRAKSLPWIDDELRVLMKQRDWLHKKAIKSGDDDLWDIYRAARNHVNVELKRSKAEYFYGLLLQLQEACLSVMETHQ